MLGAPRPRPTNEHTELRMKIVDMDHRSIACVATDAATSVIAHSERHELSSQEMLLAAIDTAAIVIAGVLDSNNLQLGVEVCMKLLKERIEAHALNMMAMEHSAMSEHPTAH